MTAAQNHPTNVACGMLEGCLQVYGGGERITIIVDDGDDIGVASNAENHRVAQVLSRLLVTIAEKEPMTPDMVVSLAETATAVLERICVDKARILRALGDP